MFALNSNRLKRLDPYHVVIGAIESIDMFVFTTKNVFVPEASLDVPMLENYAAYVAQNAAKGTAFGQVGNDIFSVFFFQSETAHVNPIEINSEFYPRLPYHTKRSQVLVSTLAMQPGDDGSIRAYPMT